MEGLKKSFLVRGNNIVGFSDKNFSTAPIGVIQAFSGQTAPHGYLLCNGASYKVADYPDLYAVIGNTYGGDTENFNVPTVQPPALTMVYIIKAFHTNEGVDSGVSDDVIEYINNLNSYSTDEQLTGGTWIDGKPIYRRVVTGLYVPIMVEGGWINIHAEPTVDTLVDLKSYDNNGIWYGAVIYRIQNGYLQGYSTVLNTKVTKYVIEYTKTTDA